MTWRWPFKSNVVVTRNTEWHRRHSEEPRRAGHGGERVLTASIGTGKLFEVRTSYWVIVDQLYSPTWVSHNDCNRICALNCSMDSRRVLINNVRLSTKTPAWKIPHPLRDKPKLSTCRIDSNYSRVDLSLLDWFWSVDTISVRLMGRCNVRSERRTKNVQLADEKL